MKGKPLTTIILLGIFLRVIFLFHHNIWLDESISILISRLAIPRLLSVASYDNNPPLFYLLLHFWMKVSQNPIWLRTLSLLFSTATIPAVFLLARSLANQKTAVLSSLLVAIMPAQLYYSGEIRFYSLLILQSALLFSIALRKNKPQGAPLTALLTATILTHYTGILGIALAFFLIWKESKRHIWVWITSAALALLLSAPWITLTLSKPHPTPWTPNPLLSVAFMPIAATTGLVGIAPPSTLSLLHAALRFLIVIVGLLFLLALGAHLRPPASKLTAIVALILVLLAASLFPILSPRLILPFTPLLYVFAATFLEKSASLRLVFLTATTAISVASFLVPMRGPLIQTALGAYRNSAFPTYPTPLTTFYPTSVLRTNSDIYLGPRTFPTQMTDVIGGTPKPIESVAENPTFTLIIDEKNTDEKTKNAIKEQLKFTHEMTKRFDADSITVQMYERKSNP